MEEEEEQGEEEGEGDGKMIFAPEARVLSAPWDSDLHFEESDKREIRMLLQFCGMVFR